jgi:hypothetical protein
MFHSNGIMASSANTVPIIFDPSQSFINLSHLAAVPRGHTIKESYTPLIGVIIQPLGVTFDLMSFSRKMSQSFLDFEAPTS